MNSHLGHDPLIARAIDVILFERGRALLVDEFGRDVSRKSSRPVKALQPVPPHPIDIIERALRDRDWTIKDLARRLGGDVLKNRALLSHYLLHPTRDLELGAIWAAKIEAALELPTDHLNAMERAWRAHRRALCGAAA